MSLDTEGVKLLLDLLNGIVTPITTTQGQQTEALSVQNKNIETLINLAKQEPTRATLLQAMRDIVKNHDDNFEETLQDHNRNCTERCNQQRVLDEAVQATARAAFREELILLLKPTTDLSKQLDKILYCAYAILTIGTVFCGWALWLLTKSPLAHS